MPDAVYYSFGSLFWVTCALVIAIREREPWALLLGLAPVGLALVL